MSSTMTIRVENKTRDQLDKLAIATGRSRSWLAAEAVQQFIEINEWQISEIRQALGEADRGEFASVAEVNRVFAGWHQRGS